jgi:8-oxo-dGTP pyrophosphatase MutT (NUDIX family)
MSTDRSARERIHRDGHVSEISYGGVVVRGGSELLVITPAGKRVTGLPKGGPNVGETPEETAVREVREETGIHAKVRERLGDVRYWYRRDGRKVHKTVTFFLCDYVSGSTEDHDHEVDDARWIPLTRARDVLSYRGERALVSGALSKLASGR